MNEKASQRHRAVLEFGVLIQPLRELSRRSAPPTDGDYRLAIAQVRGGDSAWRTHIRTFTTFAPDLKFEQEFQETSYLRIREAIAVARRRLHYFDRHLAPAFYDLFLEGVPRVIELRVVTTAKGVKAVDAVSQLARLEFADYQIVQAQAAHFHDRNLRVDDQVFSLGQGVDRAGNSLTNFGPAENSPNANNQLDKILAQGTVIHRS